MAKDALASQCRLHVKEFPQQQEYNSNIAYVDNLK